MKISAVELIIVDTWFASTVRSGSATVMSIPIAKHTPSSSERLLSLVRPEPMCSPMGVMARSAPRLNSAIPKIRNTAEMRNTTISAVVKLISGVRFRTNTRATIGSTDTRDSRSFFKSTEFMICRTSFLT